MLNSTNNNNWSVSIGINDFNEEIIEDFSIINSLIVSGVTGFGKTSFVQYVLFELMKKNTPDSLRFIIYDSKGVDYSFLENSPFLLIPIVKDENKIEGLANFVLEETINRLSGLDGSKKNYDLFFVIDDFYSCYKTCTNILEGIIVSSRRVGIHCILVSSAFTGKTLSKELSSNILNRVSFYMVDKNSSRFILDDVGAEHLIYPGEILYKKPGKITKGKAYLIDEYEKNEYRFSNKDNNNARNIIRHFISVNVEDESIDEYFEDAALFVIEKGCASIGYLQRMLRIPFDRACKILDQLEQYGVVAPENGTLSRKITMSREEFVSKYNNN